MLVVKTSKTGKLQYKARYVAKGYSQIHGVDYYDTWAPTVNPTTVRLLFAVAAMFGARVYHFDIHAAFLNARERRLLHGVYYSRGRLPGHDY